MIYELYLIREDDYRWTSIDLRAARPPAKDLTLACSQIRAEISQMYFSACERYWKMTRFVIDLRLFLDPHPTRDKDAVRSLRPCPHFEGIQHVRLVGRRSNKLEDIDKTYELTTEPGIWGVTTECSTPAWSNYYSYAVVRHTEPSRRRNARYVPMLSLGCSLVEARKILRKTSPRKRCTKHEEIMRVLEDLIRRQGTSLPLLEA